MKKFGMIFVLIVSFLNMALPEAEASFREVKQVNNISQLSVRSGAALSDPRVGSVMKGELVIVFKEEGE